jgi:hypothetical protein
MTAEAKAVLLCEPAELSFEESTSGAPFARPGRDTCTQINEVASQGLCERT